MPIPISAHISVHSEGTLHAPGRPHPQSTIGWLARSEHRHIGGVHGEPLLVPSEVRPCSDPAKLPGNGNQCSPEGLIPLLRCGHHWAGSALVFTPQDPANFRNIIVAPTTTLTSRAEIETVTVVINRRADCLSSDSFFLIICVTSGSADSSVL